MPNRFPARAATFAAILAATGCANVTTSDSGPNAPGLKVADSALQGGAPQLALNFSETVLQSAPKNATALAIKGDALAQLGQKEDAAAIFQQLLAQDPDSVRANIGLGRIKITTDPAIAESLFLRVLKHDPANLTALNNLGIARDLLGRHAEAQANYRQALALSPDLESAQVNLALSLAMSGHGSEAIAILEPKARRSDSSAKIRQDYANILTMAGRRGEAERFLSGSVPHDQMGEVLNSVTETHTQAIPAFAPVAEAPAASTAARQAAAPLPRVQALAPPVTAETTSETPRVFAREVPPPAPAPAAPARATTAMATPLPSVVAPRVIAGPDNGSGAQPTNLADAATLDPSSLSLAAQPDNDPYVVHMPAPGAVQPLYPAVSGPDRSQASSQGAAPPAWWPQVPRAAAVIAGSDASSPPPAPTVPSVTAMPPPPAMLAPLQPAAASAAAPPPPPAPVVAPAPRPVATAPASPPAAAAPASQPPAAVIASAPAAAPAPAVAVTPAATPRPKADAAPAATTAVALVTGEAHHAVSAATTAADGPAVQFSAAASEEAARAFWNTLAHKYPTDLGGRDPVILRVELNHTVFWRVRTMGFNSASEAKGLCARMQASGQACFVPRS